MKISKKELQEFLTNHTLLEAASKWNVNYFTLCRKCKKHGIIVNRKLGKKIIVEEK